MIKVEVKLLDKRVGEHLSFSTEGAAAIDLRACWASAIGPDANSAVRLGEDAPFVILSPGSKMFVGSGIAIDLGGAIETVDIMGDSCDHRVVEGAFTLASMLLPRSGLGSKLDIRLANTVGLIDADYQGEVIMAIVNGGTEPFRIDALDRLVQMVVVPVVRPTYRVVEEFAETTKRGAGGFGSTGKG